MPRALSPGAAVGMTVLGAMSLAPGLLPRGPVVQGVLTGVCLLVGAVVGMVLDRRGRRASGWVLAVCAVVLLGAGWQAQRWQDTLRAAMGMAGTGWSHWGVAAGWAALVPVGAAVLARWARPTRRAATTVAAGAAVLLAASAIGPAASAAVTFSAPGPHLAADNVVPWSTLGAEGQRFLRPSGARKVYVGVQSAPSVQARARLAVAATEAQDGFDSAAVVVAIPTGSGWVDSAAAEGFADRFDGDVTVIAVQYSTRPSWLSYLLDREAAVATASATIEAVTRRVAALPAESRPAVYVYGQSLGAYAGAAALAGVSELSVPLCGALWAGPPPATVGGSIPATHQAVVMANSSDPVPLLRPSLFFTPPAAAAAVDAPRPRWLPAASFLQTAVDLLGSLGTPAGHGHRYGAEQGRALPLCDRAR